MLRLFTAHKYSSSSLHFLPSVHQRGANRILDHQLPTALVGLPSCSASLNHNSNANERNKQLYNSFSSTQLPSHLGLTHFDILSAVSHDKFLPLVSSSLPCQLLLARRCLQLFPYHECPTYLGNHTMDVKTLVS